MRRNVDIAEHLLCITYQDLVRAAGGKVQLRRQGEAEVVVPKGDGNRRRFHVDLVEHESWRGGSRTYICCPSCRRRILRLFWNAPLRSLRCRSCWGPASFRYQSQERRRLP